MAQVLGVGGVFLICADAVATQAWYTRVLGLSPNDFGGFDLVHKATADRYPAGARTIMGLFAEPDYFAPSDLPYMLNLIVDDLEGVLARASAEGVDEVQPRETHDYGTFGWIMDPDGRKLELWEPPR